jgi:SAM-dependent methyltransferase
VSARRGTARHAAAQVGFALRRRGRDGAIGIEPADDGAIGIEPADDVRYDEAVPAAEFEREPEAAAFQTREAWLEQGRMLFDYLISHGLQPGDRMLEIGCGDLAAGHLFIDYLSAGNYYGIDFSPESLIGALQTVAEFGLQAKLPHLTLAGDLRLAFLPGSRFTVVQAHGVFARSPLEAIGECLTHVGRVMTRDAIFDFTFDRTEGVEHRLPPGDFYYRTGTLIALAGSRGLDAEVMKDWGRLGNPETKIRLTRRS